MGISARVNGIPPPEVPLSAVDLGSWDFWAQDDDVRDGAFATLRREAPVSRQPEFVQDGFEPGRGHWAVTRYDDVFYASRHPELFSSAGGIVIGDQSPELAEYFGSMIAMDDPRHARLRNIVRSAFTPRVLARIEDSVREEHHQKIFGWTNVILGFGDPEISADFDEFVTVAMDIGAYAAALADDRLARPGDDLTTNLVRAELDGQRLTSADVASFFILLVVAGNETTRNAISHGVLALSRHPEQRDDWWGDYDAIAPTAVEEIVRWASPVAYMRRTVTRDTELRGVEMAAGDKVSLWYGSANRDDAKFENPWAFHVRRHPNPHVGFGGGGAHFCLGANLARREITVVFEELHRTIPDITATAEPARLQSAFIHGIKRLRVGWTPPG